jgi:hypothetical protein
MLHKVPSREKYSGEDLFEAHYGIKFNLMKREKKTHLYSVFTFNSSVSNNKPLLAVPMFLTSEEVGQSLLHFKNKLLSNFLKRKKTRERKEERCPKFYDFEKKYKVMHH